MPESLGIDVRTRTVTSRDGATVTYQDLGNPESKRTLVLANGLGGRLFAWRPLIESLAPRWRILTWDYRGMFESGSSTWVGRLAVRDHADDAVAVLDDAGVQRAVMAGWSMGVQVSLELASEQPDRVAGLVLINGTYGHALSTAFQPLARLPWLNRYIHGTLDWAIDSPRVNELLRTIASPSLSRVVGGCYGRLRGQPRIADVAEQYARDVFGNDVRNFLRIFQELDAHSAYHLLPRIRQPALIIYGDLDVLTPAYQSREMARRLPDVRIRSFPTGTHFVLLEYPDEVVEAIETFLQDRC